MSQTQKSLTANVTLFEPGGEVITAAFVDGIASLVCANGTIFFAEPGQERRVTPHPDATILVAQSDGTRLVTGGDDGLVLATYPNGRCDELANEKGKWIDALALGRDGALLATHDEVVRLPAIAVAEKSAVGAGDSFLAGLVLALARGQSRLDALQLALATAAAAVSSPGTARVHRALVEALLPGTGVETNQGTPALRM